MHDLIIPRTGSETDLRLFSCERVMPLIRRYFQLSPDFNDVVESIGECQEEIGHKYGGQYLAYLPVERDGNVYLPLHARKVHAVYPAPWVVVGDLTYAQTWRPDNYHVGKTLDSSYTVPCWPGRQWVADQIGGINCWRQQWLEAIPQHAGAQLLAYTRTSHGVRIGAFDSRYHTDGFVRHVVVVYDAELTDERGFPMVNDRDARACAYYWNWQRIQALAFSGAKVDPNLLVLAENNMHTYIAQARVGDGLTEADWQVVMRTAASWDRTTFREGLAGPDRYPTARTDGPWMSAGGIG